MTTLGVMIPAGVPATGGSKMATLGPAIAMGAAQVVSGWMGGKGASRAAKSQALAQQQALNYQRSRDAIEDQRYAARVADYKQRYADWQARNGHKSAAAPSAAAAPVGPQTLGELAAVQSSLSGAGTPPATAGAAPAGSLGEIAGGSDWNDWRRYGAGV